MSKRKDISDEAYIEAMQQTGDSRVTLDVALLDLGFFVSALQLAMKHPSIHGLFRDRLATIVQCAITEAAKVSPVIAEVWRRGSDPAYDVSMKGE